ncbi:protocadherin Fat 1-like [Octopus sinensis]|uniref:Protocadherin Fat 1-like n=1 Tax=Octopus sinensis TaxID=2607531 RepID=A0A7E6ENX6_9MOLL|nr:protocadherin Fat 1-like [Octopus sinensis]
MCLTKDPMFWLSCYSCSAFSISNNSGEIRIESDNLDREDPVIDKLNGVCTVEIKVEYSKFSLSLKTLDGKPFTALKVIPVESVTETTIALSVNNPDELDYEKEKQMTFKIVAEDKASSKTSEANVTLEILPVDEFLPQFSQQRYQVNVSEEKTVANLITITATDDDSGKDGEVTYAIFGDNNFTIDSKSGTISVLKKLDYEKVTFYSLLVEATDGGNRKATVDLDVFVKGINDNAPIFRPKFYTGLLKEGKTSFEYEITVQATDADKENSGNSQVKYSIVNASQVLSNSFSINAQNGIITPSNIDYESLTDNVIQLVVKAEDNGKPVKEDTAVVNITVLRPESPGAANSNEKNFTSITTVTVVLVFIFIITMLLSHADNQRNSVFFLFLRIVCIGSTPCNSVALRVAIAVSLNGLPFLGINQDRPSSCPSICKDIPGNKSS